MITLRNVSQSIDRFIAWQDTNGLESFDQYDYWGTEYGIWSKQLYYKSRYLGAPFVTPVFIADIFFPESRRFFAKKKRFPIADAHLILGYLNFHQFTGNVLYLNKAKEIAKGLLNSSVHSYSGYCWGYPFNWMTTRGLWKRGVPLITTTSYCFEAYLKLFDITGDEEYRRIAKSIFDFTLHDIKDLPLDENMASCSYSPVDKSMIVNANAYRAFVLVEGYRRFKEEKAIQKANLNLNFIKASQHTDGSWLYSVNDKRDHFVDNFHTCFVIKNLIKANRFLNDTNVEYTIKRGFDFYKKYLLTPSYAPIPFAKLPRFNIVKREMYDFAEGISLCISMQNLDADAAKIAESLVDEVIGKYQKGDGSFTTRVNLMNIRNDVPFLRWPQAQLFYALTNYLIKDSKT